MSRLRMVMDQGDPFAFAGLARLAPIIGKVGGGLVKLGRRTLIPTPTGPVPATTVGSTLFPAAAGLMKIASSRMAAARAGAGGGSALAPRSIPPGAFARGAAARLGAGGGSPHRRRRMNPTNFRALQRGLRRLKAFAKLAKMVIKSEGKFKAPRKRGGFGRRRKKR